MKPKNIYRELIGASNTILILFQLLEKDSYGYELMKVVNERSEGKINLREGSFYPALSRLEDNDAIESYWETKNKRPRKYFRITTKGKELLDSQLEEWELVNQLICDFRNK